MLLALLTLAHAAPLSPVGMQESPFSLEVAGVFATSRNALKAFSDQCTGENCSAVRVETMQGGELDLRLVKQVGIYLQGGHAKEVNEAAIFTGDGWTAGGGGKLTIPLGPALGIDGWAGVQATRNAYGTQGTSGFTVSRRVVGEVGAAVHGGSSDDDILGWLGVDAVVFTDDRTLLLDNSVDLALRPGIPVSANAGFFIVSDPLGGPWTERGRIGIGASVSAGYRTGLQMWLSGAI